MTEQGSVELVQELDGAAPTTKKWAMVWTLRDGRVAGWQIHEDTARELAAHA